MTRYYGSMDSDRRKTEATCNAPNYGHVRGWDAGVKVIPDWSAPKDRDELAVFMTGGSSGSSPTRLVGTVRETPDGPRWFPAEAPGRVPARVGSPAMEVVAAIPVGAHKDNPEPDEYICAVYTRTASYGDRLSYFGTVHAYLNAETGRWSADAGNYDLSQTAAVHDMIKRAGFERPQAQH